MKRKPRHKIGGYLEIGTSGAGEVVLDHAQGSLRLLVFSPVQARILANRLCLYAAEAERETVKESKATA